MSLVIQRLKNMKKVTLNQVLKEADTKEFIIKLNQNQILIDGETVDGYNIGTYSLVTELLNQGRTFRINGVTKTKKAGSNMFLFDTGYFYRSFKVILQGDGFIIRADDSTGKDKPLSDSYGEIIGLSDESKTKLAEYLLPKLIAKTRQAMAS